MPARKHPVVRQPCQSATARSADPSNDPLLHTSTVSPSNHPPTRLLGQKCETFPSIRPSGHYLRSHDVRKLNGLKVPLLVILLVSKQALIKIEPLSSTVSTLRTAIMGGMSSDSILRRFDSPP